MVPAKLTDQDKRTILERYRQPRITAADLAAEFGVSSSTISRILRTGLPTREYERLQWLKRQAPPAEERLPAAGEAVATGAAEASAEPAQQIASPEGDLAPAPSAPESLSDAEPDTSPVTAPPRRRRSVSPAQAAFAVAETGDADLEVAVSTAVVREVAPDDSTLAAEAIQSDLELPDLTEMEETAVSEEFSDFDDEFALGSDEEEGEGEESDEQTDLAVMVADRGAGRVLSMAEAQLPPVLYLVVDRLGDLVTCPLSSFPELGPIAGEESEAQVLPLFDNHRVAKRFCKRSQKVLKVPDSRILGKTQQRLMAKGICRFLLDGNLYALN
jgi:transposase-like protein